MRAFGYARDRTCWVACALYATNRWAVPAAVKNVFLRGYFNDCLLIPAALPLMLLLERWLGLRGVDTAPRWPEVLFHLVIWSVAAEVVGPHLFPHAQGDVFDVAAYAAGAIVALLVWTRAYAARPA